jgi:hypothetical protein
MMSAEDLRKRADDVEKRAWKMFATAQALRWRAVELEREIGQWNPIETIPRDRKVLVKTVNGLDRVAMVVSGARVVKGRIYCWRRDKGHTGDLRATAWREIEG